MKNFCNNFSKRFCGELKCEKNILRMATKNLRKTLHPLAHTHTYDEKTNTFAGGSHFLHTHTKDGRKKWRDFEELKKYTFNILYLMEYFLFLYYNKSYYFYIIIRKFLFKCIT